MNDIISLFVLFFIFFLFFLFFPASFGRTGGYSKLVKKYKTRRPKKVTARYQAITVEGGYGYQGKFGGVNYYFDLKGLYIFPMFVLWSYVFPSIYIPYADVKFKKKGRIHMFSIMEITFYDESLPKISIHGKFFKDLNKLKCMANNRN